MGVCFAQNGLWPITVTRVRQWAFESLTREVCLTVYIGIDGSQGQHDVCFLDRAGELIARVILPYSPEGFARFGAHRQRHPAPLGERQPEPLSTERRALDTLAGRPRRPREELPLNETALLYKVCYHLNFKQTHAAT